MQEVARLRGLVTDLDWLEESAQGELKLTVQLHSVHKILTEEVGRWQPQSQAHQVKLSLQVSEDLPELVLDQMRMSQALGNILNNAIHCSGPDGSVIIKAMTDSNNFLVISITDEGIGIDADDLPHVFDRLYRTDQSRSRGIGGTGLGLAITQAIVNAHGGTVTVASDGYDQGTTVTIHLPLSR